MQTRRIFLGAIWQGSWELFDAKIISACILDREAYSAVAPHADASEFTASGALVWNLVVDWYAKDPAAPSVDRAILRDRVARSSGRASQIALEWFDSLPDCPSPANVGQELLELKRQIAYQEFVMAIESGEDRSKADERFDKLSDLWRATSIEDEGFSYGEGVAALLSVESQKKHTLVVPGLDKATDGGVEPGRHIVLFGRTNKGKTLLAVHLMAGWMQEGHKVLYFGNEEPVAVIQRRIMTNLLGATLQQIYDHRDAAIKRAKDRGFDNLIAVQGFPGSPSDIEKLVKEHRPQFVVVDQMRNLRSSTGRSGTRAQGLDTIARDLRQIYNRYGVVGVSIGQAHAPEHGKEVVWHSEDEFDESRTGVPGQADLIIAVGANAQMVAHNQVAVSIPKNKITADHEGFVIQIDTKRSKVL